MPEKVDHNAKDHPKCKDRECPACYADAPYWQILRSLRP